MSYQALYRKYRPRVFSDVIGQEHITATLTNQIKSGKISHAYLFTGSRGTGKTTCAKIFAKAVNCLDSKDGSPCGKCEPCVALDDPSNIDILEIDAASNNKVDEIREIREKVRFAPVKGKYKVYIIDEVHMLTDSAFNALLKTLEEPPEFVIFILATTEAHKLPATILSRCLRFDFRLVGEDELSALLKRIYKAEKKDAEPDAVDYIAGAAEGSVRDMLSIADMCLSYKSGKITYADVLNVLGAVDSSKTGALLKAAADGDTGKCFSEIDAMTRLGKSMGLIAKELTKYARDLLAIKTGCSVLVSGTTESKQKMAAEAESYSEELLISLVQIFSAADPELRYSVSPKIVLETAAIRACRLNIDSTAALSERLRKLEEKLSQIETQGIKISGKTESVLQAKEYINTPSIDVPSEKEQTTLKDMSAKSIWGRLTTYFRQSGNTAAFALAGSHTDVEVEDDSLVIYAGEEKFLQFSDEKMLADIKDALAADGIKLEPTVKKRAADIDMDDEITKIKKLIGKAKLNVIK